MIRVLIVEDEPPIARAVARLVEEHPAFAAAGIESDGKRALELLQKEQIDVVITDIRMPVMDGLTLLQHIHSEYPRVHTVILSGYQIFSYAQTAIEYQAFDYLLKPVTRERMNRLLDKLEVTCAVASKEERRRELKKSIDGETPLQAGGSDCVVMLLCAGALPHSGTDLLVPGQLFWSKVDLEGLLEQALGDNFLLFNGKHNAERIVVAEIRDTGRILDSIEAFFQNLARDNSIAITLVGHSVPVAIPKVWEIINRLRLLLYQEIRLGKSQLIWRNCMQPMPAQQEVSLDKLPVELAVEAICVQNGSQLGKIIEEVLETAEKCDFTQLDFMRFLELIINDSRIASRMNTRQYAAVKLELSEAVANTVDKTNLAKDLTSVMLLLGGESDSKGKKDLQRTMDEVEQFLLDNFNKPISNEMLSRQFGFVPSYLSKIFRKYKGLSPSEFLTHYRVERAKQFMDAKSDLLVRDIAYLVGYTDHHYFSKIFKRETGIWPTEYQRKEDFKPQPQAL